MIEFGTAHEVLFSLCAAARIRRSRAAGEFRWLARRTRNRGRRAISRWTQGGGSALRGRGWKLDYKTMTSKTTGYNNDEPAPEGGDFLLPTVRRIWQPSGPRPAPSIRSMRRWRRNSISHRCPIPQANSLPFGLHGARSTTDCNGSITIDEKLLAYQIRQLPPETLNASEAALRALIHRQLRRPDKTNVDRDKIDLLLVQYFALCAPEDLYRKDDHARRRGGRSAARSNGSGLRPPWNGASLSRKFSRSLRTCQSLRDLMEDGLRRAGTHAERFRRAHVLRSGGSGGLLPLQFSAAARLHSHVARGFAAPCGKRSTRSID